MPVWPPEITMTQWNDHNSSPLADVETAKRNAEERIPWGPSPIGEFMNQIIDWQARAFNQPIGESCAMGFQLPTRTNTRAWIATRISEDRVSLISVAVVRNSDPFVRYSDLQRLEIS